MPRPRWDGKQLIQKVDLLCGDGLVEGHIVGYPPEISVPLGNLVVEDQEPRQTVVTSSAIETVVLVGVVGPGGEDKVGPAVGATSSSCCLTSSHRPGQPAVGHPCRWKVMSAPGKKWEAASAPPRVAQLIPREQHVIHGQLARRRPASAACRRSRSRCHRDGPRGPTTVSGPSGRSRAITGPPPGEPGTTGGLPGSGPDANRRHLGGRARAAHEVPYPAKASRGSCRSDTAAPALLVLSVYP